jgi:hypothetical protein
LKQEESGAQESARLEHCPRCGSVNVRNNMYFLKGRPLRVYVECVDCREFVARYTLRGYTSDKTYESLLRRLRDARLTSGKRTLRLVEGFGVDVEKEYARVLDLIRTHEDRRKVEDLIEGEYPESLE